MSGKKCPKCGGQFMLVDKDGRQCIYCGLVEYKDEPLEADAAAVLAKKGKTAIGHRNGKVVVRRDNKRD